MFIVHGEWLARLEVVDAPPDEFTTRSADRMHELGFSDAPAHYLLEASSTDDAFELGVRERARWIEAGAEAGDGDLSRWLPPEHRAAGCALAAHLPAGVYWWLRSRVEPYPTNAVLMGNEYVDRGPHIMELVQNRLYYAAIVSRAMGTSLVSDQPLLGVPVLNYDGTERSGVLFFSCVDGDARPREERLLVVPERGVMVLDARRRFSEEEHRESLERWGKTGARGFAELLTV